MNEKLWTKILYVLLVIATISVGAAGTYAWFTWTSNDNPTVTLTIGRMADVIFASGPDINVTNLAPVFYYDEGASTTFTIRNGDASHSYQLYNVKINIEEIDSTLSSESFKYTMISNGRLIAEGSFNGLGDGDYVDVITTSMPDGNTTYTMYFYLDANIENDSSIMTKEFKGSIEVTAPELTGNIATIANLFTPGSTVVNNSISYNVDTTHSLIKDTLGNIRYYGADPSNYIYFNCETYPSTNCETWRIIGIVDGKVKLIRTSTIGSYSYDTSSETVDSGYGINQWGETTYADGSLYSGADLMKLLNPGYESNQDLDKDGNTVTVNNSLYYNSGSGYCYRWSKNETISCDFSSTGLKNSETKNKIADMIYYTRGGRYTSYPNVTLSASTIIVDTPSDAIVRNTLWKGKVAVPHLSDYAYAVDLSLCTGKTLSQYSDSTCISNNWMYNILTYNGGGYGRLIDCVMTKANASSVVYTGGSGGATTLANGVVIIPSLYLLPTETITGSGTSGNPYRLGA